MLHFFTQFTKAGTNYTAQFTPRWNSLKLLFDISKFKMTDSIKFIIVFTDNPLNCDCQIVGLAWWLRNNSKLSAANQQSAICATPPQLENAFLIDTPIEMLTCSGDDDESLPPEISAGAGSAAYSPGDRFLSSQPTEDFIRLSSAQVFPIKTPKRFRNTWWNISTS